MDCIANPMLGSIVRVMISLKRAAISGCDEFVPPSWKSMDMELIVAFGFCDISCALRM